MRRALTAIEIVVLLRTEPDGPRRRFLEERYWSLAKERHGPRRTSWYREEYEWLRRHRARQQQRRTGQTKSASKPTSPGKT